MQHSSSAKSITLLRGVNTFVHRVVEIMILRDLKMAATAQSQVSALIARGSADLTHLVLTAIM